MKKNTVKDEIVRVIEKIPDSYYNELFSFISGAGRVFVAGCGRSGLIGKCFAMRLMHLGVESFFAGETTCPPARKGDLLIVVSCSGSKQSLLSLASIAKDRKARVAALSCSVENPLSEFADRVFVVPASETAQFGNSLFEQVTFIFLEIFVEFYREKSRIKFSDMSKRHANLE